MAAHKGGGQAPFVIDVVKSQVREAIGRPGAKVLPYHNGFRVYVGEDEPKFSPAGYVQKAEKDGGFLNFTLNPAWLFDAGRQMEQITFLGRIEGYAMAPDCAFYLNHAWHRAGAVFTYAKGPYGEAEAPLLRLGAEFGGAAKKGDGAFLEKFLLRLAGAYFDLYQSGVSQICASDMVINILQNGLKMLGAFHSVAGGGITCEKN